MEAAAAWILRVRGSRVGEMGARWGDRAETRAGSRMVGGGVSLARRVLASVKAVQGREETGQVWEREMSTKLSVMLGSGEAGPGCMCR